MAKDVLKVGIVGCGEIAQVAHLPLLQELPNYEVIALCDLSEKILDRLGNNYSIDNLYLDYNDLVKKDDVDIVLVTTKDHTPITLAAMESGKHVFCEKPMCFNMEEAKDIIKAEEKNKVKMMVGLMKRYDPAFEYVLPIIKKLDDVRLVRVHDYAGDYTINSEIYDEVKNDDLSKQVLEDLKNTETEKMLLALDADKKDKVVAYSTYLYLLTHDLILLQEAFGRPTEIVYSDVYNDNNILAVLEFGEGIRCVVEGGLLNDRREWDERFEVFDNSKRIAVKFPFPYIKNAQTTVFINEQDDRDKMANVDKTINVSYDEAFKREWRHFYECIKMDRAPITNPKKASNDIELCGNIINSI